MPTPPTAKTHPTTRSVHGDETVDEYAWLRDKDDPDVRAYLEAENAHTEDVMGGTRQLQQTIFDEIKSRTLETDLSVPVRRGDWWYYGRTSEGKQYAVSCRSRTEPVLDPYGTEPPPPPADEVVILDQNELAGDSSYFALGAFSVSPDQRLLAYSTDYDGSEKYTLRIKNLDSDELLTDEVPDTSYGTAWSRDGSMIFYTKVDEAMRPYQVWRHRVGTAAEADELVHEEADERFHASIGLTRSQDWIILSLDSKITSEVWILSADRPGGDPAVVEPRRHGVEYGIEHGGDWFWVIHNDGAENFELARTSVHAPGRAGWTTVLPHDPSTRINGVSAFRDHLAVSVRRDGMTAVHVVPLADGDPTAGHDIALPEEVRTVGLGSNPDFQSGTLRISYTSLVTPATVYDYDVAARQLTIRRRQPVLGGVDLDAYRSEREWAVAPDGTRIPVSLIVRRDVEPDGSAPFLLYGYGSYEISMDPWFSIARLSLLDRGVGFAVAHVRGGGELGRHWYENGKLLAKTATFTDFVAAADRLVEAGWTSYDRLAARGGSAGGLLMGAVANLAPDKFAAIVAEVPFVDPLNTILDPSLPLTVLEWEEWGNPLESAEVYEYMRSYAPYENVRRADYPAILATAGLNDPRVSVHEPAKWVARLRTHHTGDRPILLKTEMGAGHGGPSGRYDAWRDEALVLAFVLRQVR